MLAITSVIPTVSVYFLESDILSNHKSWKDDYNLGEGQFQLLKFRIE